MADTPKKSGLLKDPWRSPPPVEKPPEAAKQPAKAAKAPPPDPDADLRAVPRATIELKGYGAISVLGAQNPTVAATILLQFLIDHNKDVERVLTKHGIVVAQLQDANFASLKFYLRRADGWTLAIPNVSSRDIGSFNLIQALLELNSMPVIKKKLEQSGISVYKF